MNRDAVIEDPRARLRRCVAELAVAIDAGECTPDPAELLIMAIVCDRQGLPDEAARLRRWVEWDGVPA
jgi:hypothetical protein